MTSTRFTATPGDLVHQSVHGICVYLHPSPSATDPHVHAILSLERLAAGLGLQDATILTYGRHLSRVPGTTERAGTTLMPKAAAAVALSDAILRALEAGLDAAFIENAVLVCSGIQEHAATTAAKAP